MHMINYDSISMTICQTLEWAKQKLAKNSIASAELDAEVILGYVLGKTKEWIFLNPKSEIRNQKQIQNSKLNKFKTLMQRRAKGAPVAYLIGHKEFFGLDFYVHKRVLVPRPETELLVEETVRLVKSDFPACANPPAGEAGASAGRRLLMSDIRIVDVGTGSGCIAIALAKSIIPHALYPITIYATDISKKALAVARKNAKRHKANIKFLQGNLLEPLIMKKIKPDIIAANLPYLRPTQIRADIRHEPREALAGGKNGLKYYEQLLKQIANAKWQMINCLLEIDPSQTKLIKKLIKKYLPQSSIKIKMDLAGRERVTWFSL